METRGDLLRTVESQKEQIQRLESRLRDVVNAYKSLLKEKDALQSSVETLQALLKSQTTPPARTTGSVGQADSGVSRMLGAATAPQNKQISMHYPDAVQPEGTSHPDEREGDHGNPSDECHQLKEQLAKLASSMSTLMEEKDKMVAAYQAEKKQLKLSYEEKLKKSEEQLSACSNDAKKLQDQCVDLRSKLKQERMEKEKNQSEHAVTLREMQHTLTEERSTKEDLEHQVEEMKKLLQGNVQQVNQATVERYEAMVAELGCQLQDVKARLKEAERLSSLPNPQVQQIQKELSNVKEQHRLTVEKEQTRADQAEDRARESARRGEARVAELEKKLAELSEIVGNYERLRAQDQLTVQKLKDRVAQLDVENTELVTRVVTFAKPLAVADSSEKLVPLSSPIGANVDELLLDLGRLKAQLKEACTNSNVPFNWQAMFSAEDPSNDESVHKKCNEELSQLKEEFERYKLRAQSVLKTKTSKDGSSNKEAEGLRLQLMNMRERIATLTQERRDEEERHSCAVEELRRAAAQLQLDCRQELALAQAEHERNVAELERELHRHRDRTIALLAEKDRELELLRSFAVPASSALNPHVAGLGIGCLAENGFSGKDDVQETSATFKELLRKTSTSSSVDMASGSGMLQLTEDQARWQGEVAALQRQKRELEADLREHTLMAAAREQQWADLVSALKDEVRRLDRNEARRTGLGGAATCHSAGATQPAAGHEEGEQSVGLEYLKNVVLSFMTSAPSGGRREQMLHAIATVLHFSPQERQQALTALTSQSWWRAKT